MAPSLSVLDLSPIPSTVRASREEPKYVIESDKIDHVAVHKGSALRKLRSTGE
jgi:hypothetical protein